jgi:exopolysaccharide biosynthesis protein
MRVLLTSALFSFFAGGLFAQTAVSGDELRAQPVPLAPVPGISIEKQMAPIAARKIKFANVIIVDPALASIRAVTAQTFGGKRVLPISGAAVAYPDAAAMINAGFFDRGGTGRVIGFMMEDGHDVDYIPEATMNSIFRVEDDGAVAISSGTELPADIKARTVYAVAGKSFWDTAADSTARCAVCITGDKKVKFITAYPVATVAEMVSYITQDEGCASYVSLDGGGSTQTLYRPSGMQVGWERITSCYNGDLVSAAQCYRPVASFLIAEPK